MEGTTSTTSLFHTGSQAPTQQTQKINSSSIHSSPRHRSAAVAAATTSSSSSFELEGGVDNTHEDETKQRQRRQRTGRPRHNHGSWIQSKMYKLKNQSLSAWRPVIDDKFAVVMFSLVALLFIPLGCWYVVITKNTNEFVLDYTDCFTGDNEATNCKDVVEDVQNQIQGIPCVCSIEFSLFNHIDNDVYFFYGLSNFFQNHRLYIQSRDDLQLMGKDVTKPSPDCFPLDYAWDEAEQKSLPVVPCGAIANSMFNDTFELECVVEGGDSVWVPLLKTGIAQPSDKGNRFRNPSSGETTSLKSRFAGTTKPVNWHKYIYELDPEDGDENNGLVNEDFIVWMRTSAFSQFRKPHRRVDHSHPSFANGLPTGVYRLHVNYSYPVTQFDGRKSIILSRTTLIGDINNFLGVMYIISGSLALFTGLFLFILHWKYSLSKKIQPSMGPDNATADLGSSMSHLVQKLRPKVTLKSQTNQ